MLRRSLLALLALILALALPLGVAAGDPPAPVARYTLRVPGLPAPGPMEVVQFLFEYAPGAATPAHTHPGLVVSFVIEGEVTFEMGGMTKVNKPGDTIIERPGEVGVARNATGAMARSIVSMVIPQGAAPSTPQPGAPVPSPAPVARYLYRTPAIIPTGEYDVAQQVLDFAPGARTPVHTHPGQVVVTVIAGEDTFVTGGQTTVYKVGDSFVELPGVAGQAGNAGTTPMTVFAAYLLPKGAPLSTPVQETPGLPNTGGGGEPRPPIALWLVALGGAGLAVGGRLVRRRLGQAP